MRPFSGSKQFQILVPWTYGCHRPIERGELQAMHSCQMQQCGVGHLSIAHDFRYQAIVRTSCQRWCGFYIVMSGMRDETAEQIGRRLAISSTLSIYAA